MTIDARIDNRKLKLAVFAITVAAGMAYLDKLTPELADTLSWITGLYIVGNVGAAAVNRLSITSGKASDAGG